MATQTATKGGKGSTKNAPNKTPLEQNAEAIDRQEDQHNKTMESLNPLEDTPKTAGQATQDTLNYVLSRREQEIFDAKTDTDITSVPFDSLVWHDNVRSPGTLKLEKMIHSLKTKGYSKKYPIVVCREGKNFLVLCGNRRTEALKAIKREEPAIFKLILPDGKVPAVVLNDLTEEEQVIIRNDHAPEEDREALDEEGIFLGIKQLVRVGVDSQSEIAAKMGLWIDDRTNPGQVVPNRSYVQQRVNLAKLPPFVQQEYIKFMREGKNNSPVRWSSVANLYKTFKAERGKGYLNGEGPEFTALWEKTMNPPQSDADGDNAGGNRMMSKSEIEKKGEGFGSWLGKAIITKVVGNPVKDAASGKDMDWSDLDAQIIRAEQAIQDLEAIKEYMGANKFKHMMTDINKKRLEASRKAEADAKKGEK